MNIDFESSQQQDINDTPITHFDETLYASFVSDDKWQSCSGM